MLHLADNYAEYSEIDPPLSTILLATRCFGRATPFPYRLIRHLFVEEERDKYDVIIQEMINKKLIRREGKHAFEVTNEGYDWLADRKVPWPIWDAAVNAALLTIGQALNEQDRKFLHLMGIHARALATIFESRNKQVWMTLTGAAVICLQESDDIFDQDEAEVLLRRIQRAQSEMENKSDG